MAREQLIARGIEDERVLAVMRRIPREKFIPRRYQNLAYEDGPLEIGRGQTISQPYIVALMSQLLELSGKEKVLEIGTGSGYQAAILSQLARGVYSLERDAGLARTAKNILKKLGSTNVKIIIGDGFLGYKKEAPYQAILLTAAPAQVPQPLLDQLANGGRLVVPVGEGPVQRLIRIKKSGKKIQEEDFGACAFVPLLRGIER